MKPWTIRMPDEILEWLRERAAMESIRQKKNVSMNAIAVQVLTKAMERTKKKKGR